MACVAFLAMAGCGAHEPAEIRNEKPAAGDAPPEGWRWETYRNVRLAVPEGWGYGTTGRQWCGRADDESPFVGRPGSLRMYGCGSQVEGTMLESGGEFVWFGADAGPGAPARVAGRIGNAQMTGERAYLQAGLVTVAVQAPEVLRQKIIDSIGLVNTDQNGCSAKAPFAGNPDWRPQAVAVTELVGIEAVSACQYVEAHLRSSTRLTGDEAVRAVRAITEAPLGAGPNSPASECVPDEITTMEHLVLQIDAERPGVVDLRYGGCFHRGLDDGTTVRTLTRAAVQPFVQGPNRVWGWSGDELSGILEP
ncbi:hypothetical protein GCM10022223_50170 [Kineosporia mesophila]|uniref:Uncharacterized protein n=1 Tax=Kineosporia mesophila TaxID=566012 RepID=A0ABP7A876_9ACTN